MRFLLVRLKLMKVILAALAKVKEDGVRLGKSGFGLLKRKGKVYTKIIPDASSSTLIPIIEKKVVPDSIVYSDCWRGYNVLDVSEFKHYRINHSSSLLTGKIISTALRTFGTKPSVICGHSTVSQRSILGYF